MWLLWLGAPLGWLEDLLSASVLNLSRINHALLNDECITTLYECGNGSAHKEKGGGVVEVEIGIKSGMYVFRFGVGLELIRDLGADLEEYAEDLLGTRSQGTKSFKDERLKVGVVQLAAFIIFFALSGLTSTRGVQALLGGLLV